MARYIDADKMIEICTKYIASVFPDSYEWAKQDAELLVAIEEAEHNTLDIVRCKKCEHHFYDEPNDCKMCRIHEYGEIWEDDDFCSKWKRRTK